MKPAIQEKIFTDLHLSKQDLLNEIALLLVKQQLAEYRVEVDFYEKKYGKNFIEFDTEFQQHTASLEQEDDWLAWKFAAESRAYWHDLLQQAQI